MAPSRQHTHRKIDTERDIRAGVAALRRQCAHMRRIHDLVGDPPLRRLEGGFEGLLRIVVSQQLSTASASSIWQRTSKAIRPFRPQTILALKDDAFTGTGLSRPKVKTFRAVAAAVAAKSLDLARLDRATDETIRGALTAVFGIGPWTADIYLLFCLGRPDAWAPGDLALQIATQRALGLAEKPDHKELDRLAERWRPWRAVAARLLWAYYAHPDSHSETGPVRKDPQRQKNKPTQRSGRA